MFSKSNKPKIFFEEYINEVNKTLSKIHLNKIQIINKIIQNTIKNRKLIFVAGNGGSASVANHFMCDFNKGVKQSSNRKLVPKVISLSNSIELITAIGNDIDFSKIFSSQVENLSSSGDCVVFFSSSGTSKNILHLIKMAKKKKLKIIAITGFCNKTLKGVDCHLDLDCKNYGITEDLFSSIMHMVSQHIKYKFDKKSIL
jgi:D-sedoheptulose 7-phosphate isomerase